MALTLLQYAALVPDLKRRGAVEVFVNEAPLFDILRFIDLGAAMGYEYNRQAALGGVGFRLLNGAYSAAAKTVGLIVPIKEGTAIMGGEVPVDRQLSKDPAVVANYVTMKVIAARRVFCRNLIDGDMETDPAGFDGLNKRVAGTASEHQHPDESAAGDELDLDTLRDMIQRVPGLPSQKRLIMGQTMQGNLEDNILAQGATARAFSDWTREGDIAAYRGVPIIDPGEDEAEDVILDFDEPLAAGTAAELGSIYCVRFGGEVDGEHLQGIATNARGGVFEVEQRGQTSTADNTLVEGRLGLVAHHPRCVQRYRYILKGVPA